VPIDGSAAPVRLVPGVSLPAPETQNFLLSPDGTRVVFERPIGTNGTRRELYSVPTAGGPAVKLNGPFVGGGTVSTADEPLVEISPDSSRVVYQADQDVRFQYEIYSAPIDGSAVPVKLNLALGGEPDVVGFRISPDSARVVYVGDQVTDGVFELFVVPLDGSSPAQKLNGALVSGGSLADSMASFRISPDSTRALYRADELVDTVAELFVVPLDLSQPPVRVSGPLVAGGDVTASFEFSHDGRQVLYVADEFQDQSLELIARPLGTLQGSKRLSGPTSGPFIEFSLSPSGQRVMYRAYQDLPNVEELFLSFVTRPYRPF
jgi:Tol biopolymer transport system component